MDGGESSREVRGDKDELKSRTHTEFEKGGKRRGRKEGWKRKLFRNIKGKDGKPQECKRKIGKEERRTGKREERKIKY